MPVASAERRRVPSILWPEPHLDDENRWLIPGDWTRGQAAAHLARQARVPFTAVRVRRRWLRWMFGGSALPGWPLQDGKLVDCDRSDPDAEPYWDVSLTGRRPQRGQ